MNRHDFLVLYFCVGNFSQSIFTLESIFAGKMLALIFFAETYFCGSLEKSQKLEPAKISCHTVSLVYLNFVCFVDSLSLFLRKTIKKIVPFVGEKFQRI